jgi:hypothetical protein
MAWLYSSNFLSLVMTIPRMTKSGFPEGRITFNTLAAKSSRQTVAYNNKLHPALSQPTSFRDSKLHEGLQDRQQQIGYLRH